MPGLTADPYRAFVVGLVRVAVWKDTGDDRPTAITVERNRPGIRNEPNYSPVLAVEDVSKAILALKQAHDFLQASLLDWEQENDSPTEHRIPERIP